MLDDAIEEIRKALPNLTLLQQKIGSYFCAHPEALGVMSLGELAENIGTSQPTVIRFCRAMGYRGFVDFSRRMREMKDNKISHASYFRRARIKNDTSGKPGEMASMLVEKDEANVRKLMKNYPGEDILKCVELMEKCSSIAIVGRMSAYPAAIYFEQLLSKITPKIYPMNGADILQAASISRMDKSSLVFFIAFPRYPRVIVELSREISQTGAAIVGITKNNSSPFAQVSDILFTCNVEPFSYIDLFGPVFALINILCMEFSLAQSAKSEIDLAKYDHVVENAFFTTKSKYANPNNMEPKIDFANQPEGCLISRDKARI